MLTNMDIRREVANDIYYKDIRFWLLLLAIIIFIYSTLEIYAQYINFSAFFKNIF